MELLQQKITFIKSGIQQKKKQQLMTMIAKTPSGFLKTKKQEAIKFL